MVAGYMLALNLIALQVNIEHDESLASEILPQLKQLYIPTPSSEVVCNI